MMSLRALHTLSVACKRMGRIVSSHSRLAAALLVGWCLLGGAPLLASDPVIRVEEDWRVEISMPDPDDHAPQIINVMSPLPSLDWVHVVFELNHSTLPDYLEGGMQLQRWFGEYPLNYRNFPTCDLLHHSEETITYTLSMEVEAGKLTFEVENGNSETWGTFGGQGYLKHSEPTILSNLDLYDATGSVVNSRIGYASHRVTRFVLTEVRYYSALGLVATDETDRVVHEHTITAE